MPRTMAADASHARAAKRGHSIPRRRIAGMDALPVVRLKNAWNSTHPWIFQRLVDKPATRPKPGSLVEVVGVDGSWIGRGFYNGHSRIALRMLESDPDVVVDADW